MAEYIREKEEVLAIIVPSSEESDEIAFFTDKDSSQQLGLMNRPEGYSVEPHIHPENKRSIEGSDEVLFVRSGKIKVEVLGDELREERILGEGDVVLLRGGHSVEMLQDSEVIAVKQGPYREGSKEFL